MKTAEEIQGYCLEKLHQEEEEDTMVQATANTVRVSRKPQGLRSRPKRLLFQKRQQPERACVGTAPALQPAC